MKDNDLYADNLFIDRDKIWMVHWYPDCNPMYSLTARGSVIRILMCTATVIPILFDTTQCGYLAARCLTVGSST